MDPDELLVRRAIKGDQYAFQEIVLKYQIFIFAICMNIIKDSHEAENVAQETFIQIYRSLTQYNNKSFKSWIGRVAANKAIDWKRKRKAENIQNVIYLDDISGLEEQRNDNLQDRLIKKEDREKVISLCNELPQKYQVVIKKYYIQSKSYQEISKEEGISIKTVESRLYRAKKTLRDRWGKEERLNETL